MDKSIKRKKTDTFILAALLAVTYLLIYFLSAEAGENSLKISAKVSDFLMRIYYGLIGVADTGTVAAAAANTEGGIRKLAHFVEYMAVGFLSLKLFSLWCKSKWKAVCIVVLQLIISGGLDELHQYFVPGRVPAVKDVCIDTAGGIVGMLIVFGLKGIGKLWKRIQRRE